LKQFVTWEGQTSRRVIMRVIGDFLFLILFFVLVGAWLLFWAAFHIAGGLIHLLLIIAAISLILHLFRHRSAA
jgi:hypothetical protein